MEMLKVRVSTEDLITPGQIGWIFFHEGDAEIGAKIIRGRNGIPFIALPTAFRKGKSVSIVNFDPAKWESKKRELIRLFRSQVGEDHYLTFKAPIERR